MHRRQKRSGHLLLAAGCHILRQAGSTAATEISGAHPRWRIESVCGSLRSATRHRRLPSPVNVASAILAAVESGFQPGGTNFCLRQDATFYGRLEALPLQKSVALIHIGEL